MALNKKRAGVTCVIGAVIALVTGHYASDGSSRSKPSKLAPQGNTLRFSKDAMEIMGNAEGCRKDPYMCPANRLTAGVGHTGSDVHANVKQYSMDQIAKWFAQDQLTAQTCLEQNVEDHLGHRLPQSVFDAYGSFIFNVGCGKFKSYPVYRLLREPQYFQACTRLKLYNKAAVNGKLVVLPGLATRREKESNLCERDL